MDFVPKGYLRKYSDQCSLIERKENQEVQRCLFYNEDYFLKDSLCYNHDIY